MKIIPLFNEELNDNSSKLLAIENINNFKFDKIKYYQTVNLNENFSINYLNKILKLNKSCTIIFNDFKLILSNGSYSLQTRKNSDGYKIIFSLRNNNFIKCVTALNHKLYILLSLFEENKFYLNNSFNHIPFSNLVNIYNILHNFNVNNNIIPTQNITYKKLNSDIINQVDNFIKIIIKSKLNVQNIKKILKVISYIENKVMLADVLSLVINKIKTFEFEDSLLGEVLNMIPSDIKLNNIINSYNLLKLIELNEKSKKLLDELKLEDINEKSIELYSSVITRTHWAEELEYGNIMGLLLNICPKEINKNAYNLDYIPINEITHTLIGFDQLLEAYKMNINENHDDDLFRNVMSGYGVGEGNCILPLYINQKHWNFVSLYMEYNLGIIFNRNPLLFHNNHKNVYKNVLVKMINLTFCDDNYKSDKWLNLLFSVLRTNYELFKNDNSFVSRFIKDKKFRITCNLNNILLDYLFSKNNAKCINLIFEELIRRTFKSLYKNIDILDSVYKFTVNSALNYEKDYKTYFTNDLINDEEFNNWISNLEMNYIFSEKITLIYAIVKMKEVINKKDFFENFDKNCGILDEESLDFVKEFVLDKKIVPENCELLGILNPKFSSHVNFTKDKIFSVNTFIKLNLIENREQLYGIFIQGLLQRVDKCRKKALDNNKVDNPFLDNEIVKNVGLLMAQRFIKKSYNLVDSHYNYFNVINTIDDNLLEIFVETMIKKTISVRKHILNSMCNITNENRRNLVRLLIE